MAVLTEEEKRGLKQFAKKNPELIDTGAGGVIPFMEKHYKGRPIPSQAEIRYLEAFLRGEGNLNR